MSTAIALPFTEPAGPFPGGEELAARTAAAIVAHLPLPIAHVPPAQTDVPARLLEEIDEILAPRERLSLRRIRRSEWEASTYDPDAPPEQAGARGSGRTVHEALKELRRNL